MKVIASNKKVAHDYFILDSFEAGIVLKGTEIKSVRLGKVNINDSYARIKDYECFLVNSHIAKYAFGNIFNHDETRERKLLLTKHEIIRLFSKIKTDNLTLIPTKVYIKDGFCKVELALCKGKKLHDKRDDQKAKDQKERLEKTIKNYRD